MNACLLDIREGSRSYQPSGRRRLEAALLIQLSSQQLQPRVRRMSSETNLPTSSDEVRGMSDGPHGPLGVLRCTAAYLMRPGNG